MFPSATQFTNPLAATFAIRATNFQLPDPPQDRLIQHGVVVMALTEGARLTVDLDPVNAVLAKVVATAAGEVRVTKDGQTNRAMEFLRRALHEVDLVRDHALSNSLGQFPGWPTSHGKPPWGGGTYR